MSLVEDISTVLENGFSVYDITGALPDVRLVEDEIVDTSRWYIHHEAIYMRSEPKSYACVSYSEPATEYQDATDEPVAIYKVEPYEITVTKYRKV
jgi:hypothetical protein